MVVNSVDLYYGIAIITNHMPDKESRRKNRQQQEEYIRGFTVTTKRRPIRGTPLVLRQDVVSGGTLLQLNPEDPTLTREQQARSQWGYDVCYTATYEATDPFNHNSRETNIHDYYLRLRDRIEGYPQAGEVGEWIYPRIQQEPTGFGGGLSNVRGYVDESTGIPRLVLTSIEVRNRKNKSGIVNN